MSNAAPLPVPVFDIGGVLLDWDPRHLYRRLFDDSGEMEQFLATVCTPAWNHQMDAGRLFGDAVAELTAAHPDQAELICAFDERWTETVRGAIAESVVVLADLKGAGHSVYAITNFSAEKFQVARRHWPFLNLFDGVLVSGEVRLTKPDPDIYRLFAETFGLALEACSFVDDNQTNVDAAADLGMAAHRFTDAASMRDWYRSLGFGI